MDSTVRDADAVKGGDKWMLALGWACFVGIGLMILSDLALGLIRCVRG